MGRILPRVLDTKYKNILSWERSLAKAVASGIIEFQPVTVWEIMIPVLFLLNFFQQKRARETFSLNFLFTKKMALEAAFGMIDRGKAKEQAKAEVKEKTDKILAADAKGIYSSKIRQKQMKEIDLLIDHYCRLLEAE
ncbi:MAG: NF038143 family protein, partial [Deltaproteobacteria bacterium]|nr:NF038143 family protein [Deltaproteobacteria bacterium]